MPTNAGPKDALLKQNKQLILVQAENFGLEELLTALHDQVLAPSETSVRTWFTAAKARADEQWLTERECSREPEPPRTVTYQVVWNGAGTINPHESTVTNSITPARFVRAA